MTDLIAIMSKLVDPTGKILIPGIEEMVEPATDEERSVRSPALHPIDSKTINLGKSMNLLIILSQISNNPQALR